MKLELDVWRVLNVCTMFQNGISKHVEKNPGNFAKYKRAEIIAKIQLADCLVSAVSEMAKSRGNKIYV